MEATKYHIGKRIEMHPARCEWMQGDRYGTIVGIGKKREYVDHFTREHFFARPFRVKLDKSSRIVRCHPEEVSFID